MNGESSILISQASNGDANAPPQTITRPPRVSSHLECDSSCVRGHKQLTSTRLILLAAAAVGVLLLCAFTGASFFVSLFSLRRIQAASGIERSLHLRGTVKGIGSEDTGSYRGAEIVHYLATKGTLSHWEVFPSTTVSRGKSSTTPGALAVVTDGANFTLLAAGMYRIRVQLTVVLRRRAQYFSASLLLSETEAGSGPGQAPQSEGGLASTQRTEQVLARCHEGSLVLDVTAEVAGDEEREWSTRCSLEITRRVSALATLRVSFHMYGGSLNVLCEEGATFMDIVRLDAS